MKVRSGPNVRIMTQLVSHYRHACYQNVNDTGTMPAFGVSRELRTVNCIQLQSGARKVKVLKSGIRRINYK